MSVLVTWLSLSRWRSCGLKSSWWLDFDRMPGYTWFCVLGLEVSLTYGVVK